LVFGDLALRHRHMVTNAIHLSSRNLSTASPDKLQVFLDEVDHGFKHCMSALASCAANIAWSRGNVTPTLEDPARKHATQEFTSNTSVGQLCMGCGSCPTLAELGDGIKRYLRVSTWNFESTNGWERCLGPSKGKDDEPYYPDRVSFCLDAFSTWSPHPQLYSLLSMSAIETHYKCRQGRKSNSAYGNAASYMEGSFALTWPNAEANAEEDYSPPYSASQGREMRGGNIEDDGDETNEGDDDDEDEDNEGGQGDISIETVDSHQDPSYFPTSSQED
jgi:hypothetical protein